MLMFHNDDPPDSRNQGFAGVLERARGPLASAVVIGAILLIASALRFAHLGRLSLWYDEVVPMRLARQQSPGSLLHLLFQIEATRAPLHPLVLQAWLRLFGPSDIAGRALSALCGIATVGLVYRIGRMLFDAPTARWAAWLAAVSPLLVLYSQEAKMYAWLVFVTCVSWDLFLKLRDSDRIRMQAAYAFSLVALAYSHPLGLLMVGTQGLAYLANRSAFKLTWPRWVAIEATVALGVAPWVRHYLDHAPEITSESLALRFLLGLPIGFTGGGRWTLLACVLVIAYGMLQVRPRTGFSEQADVRARATSPAARIGLDRPTASSLLLIWFAAPPLLLYGYSWVSHPIFGQARYTLYVVPAYLLLLARGLVKLPCYLRYPLAIWLALQAALMLSEVVYAPDLKADWRAATSWLREGHGEAFDTLVVVTKDPANTVEVKTARYYLGTQMHVIALGDALADTAVIGAVSQTPWVGFAVPTRGGRPLVAIPQSLLDLYDVEGGSVDFPGLRLSWRRRESRQER
jgi:mannosyltransferase